MARKREDVFSPATKRLLADRVNHFCSNPDCRAPTSGPCRRRDQRVSVGDAAHITAASPGGPRYDPSLTSEQRRRHGNGIWLCVVHARVVDRDHSNYSVNLLRRWKSRAEAYAKAELGKPQVRMAASPRRRSAFSTVSQKEVEAFSALSLQEKKAELIRIWTRTVRQEGFRNSTVKGWPVKTVSARAHAVRGCALPNVSKVELRNIEFSLSTWFVDHLNGKLRFNAPLTVHCFYFSLAVVTRKFLEQALPNYRVTEVNSELIAKKSKDINHNVQKPFRYGGGICIGGNNWAHVPICIHIVSGIQSTASFSRTLQPIVEAIR